METLFVMGNVVQGIQTVRGTLRLKISKHVRLYGQRLQTMDLGSCKLAFHCSKTWSENFETRLVV